MRRKTSTLLAVAAATALVLAGCSSGSDDKKSGGEAGSATGSATGSVAADGGGKVSVTTWWSAGSEAKGLAALETVFSEKYPQNEFFNAAVAGGGGDNAKQKLQADLASGNPPDTFQAHAGAELNDYISAGQLQDVSGLYDEFKLRDVFPESLIDRLTVDGKIYSIPSNIHRANVVWANPQVMRDAGLDPDKPAADLDAWIADMEKVAAAGKTPITIAQEWTQLHLLETVLVASMGVDAYNGLWDGTTDWNGAEVTKALGQYDKIFNLAKSNGGFFAGQDWEPAMGPIVKGEAAFNVMGDWAVAYFDSEKKVYGTDYLAFPVPGSDGVFDFLADSFTLPVGAPNEAGAKHWLDVISSAEGQLAFNQIKGSIPARTDIDASEFGPYQQDAMKSFAQDQIVSSVAHGAAAPLAVSEAMKTALGKFAQGASDVAGLQSELAAAAALAK